MWTRDMLILACCLAPAGVLAAPGSVLENAEVIPTPAASAPGPSAAAPDNVASMSPDAPCVPWGAPWWYWWYPCHGRGQHSAYLPPLPGWYYFRPYSVSQLRVQQEAVQEWGGDPRNPYADGVVQPQRGQRRAAPAPPEAAADVIKWPPALRDPRFASQRARIETPYRRNLKGQAGPTAEDYQNMIDAAEQMKAVLGQTTTDISAQDCLNAERFLNRLAAEARRSGTACELCSNSAFQQQPAPRRAVLAATSEGTAFATNYEFAQPSAATSEAAANVNWPADPQTAVENSPAAALVPATDVVKWPAALRGPRFAAQRATIEAPYCRDPRVQPNPTAADYQNMIDAVWQMKDVLVRMNTEISTPDYFNAVKFLNQLAAEAREQIAIR